MSELDQSKLAELCGVDRSYIARLKNGTLLEPRDDVLVVLASALSQDVDDYRLAILADRGRLPAWHKVWKYQTETGLGVQLSSEDIAAMKSYALTLVRRAAEGRP